MPPAAAPQGEGEGAADAEADAARSETLSLLQARVAEDRRVWRDGTQPLSDEDKARRRDESWRRDESLPLRLEP